MAQKIGFYSLRKVAREMCRFIFIFSPVIRAKYPNNALLLAALSAAEVACHNLVEQIDLQAPQGV